MIMLTSFSPPVNIQHAIVCRYVDYLKILQYLFVWKYYIYKYRRNYAASLVQALHLFMTNASIKANLVHLINMIDEYL